MTLAPTRTCLPTQATLGIPAPIEAPDPMEEGQSVHWANSKPPPFLRRSVGRNTGHCASRGNGDTERLEHESIEQTRSASGVEPKTRAVEFAEFARL
jgi:hypothetical protein